MAAHRYHHQGWLDTPVHPLLGVTMFVVGALADPGARVDTGRWLQVTGMVRRQGPG